MEVLRRDTLKQCKEEVSIQVRRGPGGTPAREGVQGGHGGPWELRMEDGRSGVPEGRSLSALLCPQRQVRHPFVHGLGDSWQGQRHLFISE